MATSTQDQIFSNLQAMGYTNVSSTAIYVKIAQALGLIVDNTITEINNSETTITNILISQYGYGKPLYYTENAIAFQYGDNLIINTAINPATGSPYLNLIYATIDTTLQIVNQAAFSQVVSGNNIQLFLKIANLNATTGLLQPLTTDQYNAFNNYFLNFTIPGLPVSVINISGNILNFQSNCTYYTAFDFSLLQTNIATAFNSFLANFQFDGNFYSGDLESYIKANVPGVRDFFIFNTTLDGTPFSGSQELPSGYFNYNTGIISNIAYNAIS